METRTKDEPVATLLSYDRSGVLVAEKKTARQVGTTVAVKNLFSNLPVRSKEFSRNIRKEYGKLITLLNVSFIRCFFFSVGNCEFSVLHFLDFFCCFPDILISFFSLPSCLKTHLFLFSSSFLMKMITEIGD